MLSRIQESTRGAVYMHSGFAASLVSPKEGRARSAARKCTVVSRTQDPGIQPRVKSLRSSYTGLYLCKVTPVILHGVVSPHKNQLVALCTCPVVLRIASSLPEVIASGIWQILHHLLSMRPTHLSTSLQPSTNPAAVTFSNTSFKSSCAPSTLRSGTQRRSTGLPRS